MTPPREVPGWDEFYLGLAYQYAERSKDPSTQIGAVIVDPHYVPLGFGCNGASKKIKDTEIDWSRPAKYPFMRHAEENAIRHCRVSDIRGLDNCILYVTGHPCSRCMNQLVDYGITRIVYGPMPIKMVNEEETALSKHIAEKGKVKVEKFEGNLSWVLSRTQKMESLGLFKNNIWE